MAGRVIAEHERRCLLLFLGNRSFEFEDGQHGVSEWGTNIVERGGGLRREIFLVGSETKWLAAVLLEVSRRNTRFGFIDRITKGNRSVACWLRRRNKAWPYKS